MSVVCTCVSVVCTCVSVVCACVSVVCVSSVCMCVSSVSVVCACVSVVCVCILLFRKTSSLLYFHIYLCEKEFAVHTLLTQLHTWTYICICFTNAVYRPMLIYAYSSINIEMPKFNKQFQFVLVIDFIILLFT